MNKFSALLKDRTVREVHAQPKRSWLPITAEHGAYQADLLFLDAYAHQNRGYNGILVIVEIGNRYAFAIPIKGKDDTYRAFNVFLDEAKKIGHDVVRVESDGGSEFVNKRMKALFAERGIEQTIMVDSRATGIVERFNGTLRGWIARWLTGKDTNNWIDAMPDILEHYNARPHKTTGMAPDAMSEKDEDRVRDRIDLKASATVARVNSLAPGDRVRVLMYKKAFGKGRMRWSDNVHTIEGRVDGTNSFTLVGHDGAYKYSDLQRVGTDSVDVRPKAPVTVALAKKRDHALKLSREGLTRQPGVRAAEELIEAEKERKKAEEDARMKAAMSHREQSDAPMPPMTLTLRGIRSTRERKAPGEWWMAGK